MNLWPAIKAYHREKRRREREDNAAQALRDRYADVASALSAIGIAPERLAEYMVGLIEMQASVNAPDQGAESAPAAMDYRQEVGRLRNTVASIALMARDNTSPAHVVLASIERKCAQALALNPKKPA